MSVVHLIYLSLPPLFLTRNPSFSEMNHFIWSEEYQVLWTEKHESTILLLETASSGSEVNFGMFLRFE